MSVRLRDIADAVGVSVQVVSKVLNGGESNVGASPETRQRIAAAASRLGYRRNAAGLALRKQSFRSVGLLLGDSDQSVFMPQKVLSGLVETLAGAGFTCTLMSAGRMDARTIADQRLLNEHLVDALILANAQDPPAELTQALRLLDMPALWVHRDVRSNAVAFDECQATDELVTHLVQRGRHDIAYLDYNGRSTQAPASRQRHAGYERACERHDLVPRYMNQTRVERAQRAAYTHGWITRPDAPDAVVVDSFSAAQVVLDVAHQAGVEVPKRLAIASFDNGTNTTANAPAITAAIVPEHELGVAAGEMALALAQKQRQRLPSRRLRCPLFVGGTT